MCQHSGFPWNQTLTRDSRARSLSGGGQKAQVGEQGRDTGKGRKPVEGMFSSLMSEENCTKPS